MTTKSELPETMKAAVVEAAGPPKTIHIKEVPVPRLSRQHVIIALEYAGLGTWDASPEIGRLGIGKAGNHSRCRRQWKDCRSGCRRHEFQSR